MKYSDVPDICTVCFFVGKLTNTHLKNKHNLNREEYYNQFPRHFAKNMNFCKCGCGERCKTKYIRGHNNRGTTPWNKDLTKEEHPSLVVVSKKLMNNGNGFFITEEGRQKHSEVRKNFIVSDHTRELLSISMKKRLSTVEGQEQHRKFQQIGTKAAQEANPSSIEIIMWELLKGLGVSFQTQVKIGKYTADIVIPDLSLIIEADGCYWHGCTECGFEVTEEMQSKQLYRDIFMKKQGYRTARIWEHELRKTPQAALKRELEFGKMTKGY